MERQPLDFINVLEASIKQEDNNIIAANARKEVLITIKEFIEKHKVRMTYIKEGSE